MVAADRDLSAVANAVGPGTVAAVTVANALHHMDPVTVFDACARLVTPSGGVAVITHGQPLWLAESDWTRALRVYLEHRAGPLRSICGTDPTTLEERRSRLTRAGFTRVEVLQHRYLATVDAAYVLGHLTSAMPADLIAADRRADFEQGLHEVLRPYEDRGGPVEDVAVSVLIGQR